MARNRATPYLQSQTDINKAMVDGVGGLQFVAQAPPGIGRLIRIPFYLVNGVATQIAALAANQTAAQINARIAAGTVSSAVPAVIVDFAAITNNVTSIALMQTPQISWATLRIVGFEASVRYPQLAPSNQAEITFSDLKVGGGANLFVHEDFAPASIYAAGQASFAGLRDYPILKSPNVAQVAALLVGDQDGETVTWSASLLAEVLVDDNYGAHIPGAYARKGALVRQGGSFV